MVTVKVSKLQSVSQSVGYHVLNAHGVDLNLRAALLHFGCLEQCGHTQSARIGLVTTTARPNSIVNLCRNVSSFFSAVWRSKSSPRLWYSFLYIAVAESSTSRPYRFSAHIFFASINRLISISVFGTETTEMFCRTIPGFSWRASAICTRRSGRIVPAWAE